MKTRFIINPIAGTGKQKGISKHIAKHFKNYDIVETKKPGDAKKLSLEAVNNQYQTIIAVGGDGTVNECLESVINTKTALGVIPCGSGNGFALHIGMLSSPKEALKQLKRGVYSKVELNSGHIIQENDFWDSRELMTIETALGCKFNCSFCGYDYRNNTSCKRKI